MGVRLEGGDGVLGVADTAREEHHLISNLALLNCMVEGYSSRHPSGCGVLPYGWEWHVREALDDIVLMDNLAALLDALVLGPAERIVSDAHSVSRSMFLGRLLACCSLLDLLRGGLVLEGDLERDVLASWLNGSRNSSLSADLTYNIGRHFYGVK